MKSEINKCGVWLFANPRSGSTLLFRLIRAAGHAICSDFPMEVIAGWNRIYEFESGLREYDQVVSTQPFVRKELEQQCKEGLHPKWYAGWPTKPVQLAFLRSSLCSFFGSCCPYYPSFKNTQLFFGEQEESRKFVSMLHELFVRDDSYLGQDYQLIKVFLRRSPEKIAKSAWSIRDRFHRVFPESKAWKEDAFKQAIIELVEQQNQNFKKISGLGAVHINYADLIKDPIGQVRRFLDFPVINEHKLTEVMKTKTR